MRSSAALCVALIGFGQAAAAQEAPSDPPPVADLAPLAGPEVSASRPDLLEQGLTMGAMPGMQMGGVRQLGADDMDTLLQRLDSDEVDRRTRLSDRQRERIAEVRRAHQQAVRAHRREHAERFRELREAAGHTVEPRVPDAEAAAEAMDARRALRSLYQSGPTAGDLQIKLFAELTGVQQDWVDAEIERIMSERRRARAEQRYADELNAEPVDPATFFNDDGTVDLAALPERLRRQMAELDEPQRGNRLRRIIERASRLQSASAAEPQRASGRKAPALETVQVPNADD